MSHTWTPSEWGSIHIIRLSFDGNHNHKVSKSHNFNYGELVGSSSKSWEWLTKELGNGVHYFDLCQSSFNLLKKYDVMEPKNFHVWDFGGWIMVYSAQTKEEEEMIARWKESDNLASKLTEMDLKENAFGLEKLCLE